MIVVKAEWLWFVWFVNMVDDSSILILFEAGTFTIIVLFYITLSSNDNRNQFQLYSRLVKENDVNIHMTAVKFWIHGFHKPKNHDTVYSVNLKREFARSFPGNIVGRLRLPQSERG